MIGAGNIGLTFAERVVDSPHIKNKHLPFYDKSEEVRQHLKEDSMEDNNVNTLIKDAAYATFHRALELGQEN